MIDKETEETKTYTKAGMFTVLEANRYGTNMKAKYVDQTVTKDVR